MKRKIAILLAATMTLSAVPTFAAKVVTSDKPEAGLTAVASQGKVLYDTTGTDYLKLEPSKVELNNESAKVEAYKNELQKREGVLKIDLNSGRVDNFDKGTEIIIKLENGVFPSRLFNKQDPEELAYRNAYFQTKVGASSSIPNAESSQDGYEDTSRSANLYVKDGKLYKGINGKQQDLSASRASDFSKLMSEIQVDIGKATHYAQSEDSVNKITASLPHIPYTITVKDEKMVN